MTEIVCAVLPGGTAYVAATDDVGQLVRDWGRRQFGPLFLPVSSVKTTVAAFESVTGLHPPLRVPLRTAAAVFGRLGVSGAASGPFQRHIVAAGGEAMAPLFREWRVRVAEVLQSDVTRMTSGSY